jgi:exonuclease III
MKIDYLLTTADLAAACLAHGLWDDCIDGIYLSDHYPVWADFDLDAL